MPSLVIVTTGAATNGGATDAWRAVRSDSDLQFAPIAPPDPPQTPEWLRAVGEILNSIFGPVAHAIAAAWPVLQWVLVAIGVALLIMLVVRILGLDVFKRRDVVEEAEVDLAPDRAEAQALLSDADALAAQGRYGEAVRLLLARSIERRARFIRAVEPRGCLRNRRQAQQTCDGKCGNDGEAAPHGVRPARSAAAMIGVTGNDGRSAVELLRQHGASKQMRPGRLAEGEQQVGLAALVFGMPVGGAQYEAAFAHTVVPPASENVRQILGREIFPALIEQDGLVRRLRLGNAAPGFGQFGEFHRPCQPLLIARDKFSLGRARNFSASDDMKQNDQRSRNGGRLGPFDPGNARHRPPWSYL